MSYDEIEEIELEEFGFQARRPIQLFTNNQEATRETIHDQFINYLSISYTNKVIIAYLNNELKIVKIDEISKKLEEEEEDDDNKCITLRNTISYKIGKNITQLVLNADETHLLLAFDDNSIGSVSLDLLINNKFHNDAIDVINSFNSKIINFLTSKKFSNLSLVLLESNDLYLVDLQNKTSNKILSNISAANWYGSSIIIGNSNANNKVDIYSIEDLNQPFKSIPINSFDETPNIYSFKLIDDNTLLTVLGDSLNSVETGNYQSLIIDLENDSNIKYTDRIYSPFGVIPRMSSFYSVTLSHWSEKFSDILFSIGSKSIDFDTLTPNLLISQLNDSDRASMPMDEETDDDDTPLGFILDLQATEKVLEPCKTLDSCDPLPRFIVLTNRGQLLSWNIWYTKDISLDKVSLLNALNSKLEKVTSSTVKTLSLSLKNDSQTSSLFSNNTTVTAGTPTPNVVQKNPEPAFTFGKSSSSELNSNPFGSTSASAFGNFGNKSISPASDLSSVSTSNAFKNIAPLKTEASQFEENKETTPIEKPFGKFSSGNISSGNTNTGFGSIGFGQSGFEFSNTSSNTTEASKTAFGQSGFGFSNTSSNTTEANKTAFGQSGFGFSTNTETKKSAFGSFTNTTGGFAAFSGNSATSSSPFSDLNQSSDKNESIFGDVAKTIQNNSSGSNSFNNIEKNGFSFGQNQNLDNGSQNNSNAFSQTGSSFGQQNSSAFGNILGNNSTVPKTSGFGAFSGNPGGSSPFANLVKDKNKSNNDNEELFGNSNETKPSIISTETKGFSFGNFGNSLNEINDESKIKEIESDEEDQEDYEDEDEDEVNNIEESESESESGSGSESGSESESESESEFKNKNPAQPQFSFIKKIEQQKLESQEAKPVSKTELINDISDPEPPLISAFGNFDASTLNKSNNFGGNKNINVDQLSLSSKHDDGRSISKSKPMIFNNLDDHKEKSKVKDIIANFNVDDEKSEKVPEKIHINLDNTEIAKKMALWEERRQEEANVKKEEESKKKEEERRQEEAKVKKEEESKEEEEEEEESKEEEEEHKEQEKESKEEEKESNEEEKESKEEEEKNKEKEEKLNTKSQDEKERIETKEKTSELSEDETETKQERTDVKKEPIDENSQDKSESGVKASSDIDNESKESFELVEKENYILDGEQRQGQELDKKNGRESKPDQVTESPQLPVGEDSNEITADNEIEKELVEETKELSQLALDDNVTADVIEHNKENDEVTPHSTDDKEVNFNKAEKVADFGADNKEVEKEDTVEGEKTDLKENEQGIVASKVSDLLPNSLHSSKYAVESDKLEKEEVEEKEPFFSVGTDISTLEPTDSKTALVKPPDKEIVNSKISTDLPSTTTVSADPKYINASMEIQISKEVKLQNFEDNEVYFSKLYIPKSTPILISRGNIEYPEVTSNLPPMSQEMMKIIYDVSVEFDVLHKNITLLREYLSDQMDDEIIIHTLEKSLAFSSFWRFCEAETIAKGIESEFQEFEALKIYFTDLESNVNTLHQDILKDTKDMASIEKELMTSDNLNKSQLEISNSDTPLSFENVYKRRSLRDKIGNVQKTQRKLQSTVLFLNSQLNPTKLIEKPENLEIILSNIDSKIRNHLDTVKELKETIELSLVHGEKRDLIGVEQSSDSQQQYSLILAKDDAKTRMASMITRINSKNSVAEILSDRQFNLSYYTL